MFLVPQADPCRHGQPPASKGGARLGGHGGQVRDEAGEPSWGNKGLRVCVKSAQAFRKSVSSRVSQTPYDILFDRPILLLGIYPKEIIHMCTKV